MVPTATSSNHHNSQPLKNKNKKKTLMAARSVNTRSLPSDVITHTPTNIKGQSSQITQPKENRKSCNKGRNRYPLPDQTTPEFLPPLLVITTLQSEHPDGFQDPPTSIRIIITSYSNPQPQGQTQQRPLQLLFAGVPGIKIPVTPTAYCQQPQQPVLAGAPETEMPEPPASCFQQTQQLALTRAPGTEMPEPPASYFHQPKQLASTGAPGTKMPAPSASCFQQTQELASTGASGSGMPAPSAACFQQPQHLATTGAPGSGMPAPSATVSSNHSSLHQPQHQVPVPYAGMQGASISQLHQSQQLMSAGVIGTRMPAPISPLSRQPLISLYTQLPTLSCTKIKQELQPSLACRRQLHKHPYLQNRCHLPLLSSFL